MFVFEILTRGDRYEDCVNATYERLHTLCELFKRHASCIGRNQDAESMD